MVGNKEKKMSFEGECVFEVFIYFLFLVSGIDVCNVFEKFIRFLKVNFY